MCIAVHFAYKCDSIDIKVQLVIVQAPEIDTI